MPRALIAPGEHYHIFNRGVKKDDVFLEEADYVRMLFLILFLQSDESMFNIGRYVKNFLRFKTFNIPENTIGNIAKNKSVELVEFILMPNHFHLLVREVKEGGISLYLQRVEIAYTKYFNTKYRKSGYLFQGPYQSVHIESNEQLLHLSAYIHKNIGEFKKWKDKEYSYRWSSYQYYLGKNGWQGLLVPGIILGQFKTPEEYKNFVETSGVKEFDPDLLIDP